MESFSLLKYWRGSGGGGGGGGNARVNPRSSAASGGTTTIVTSVTTRQTVDTDDDDDDDDGPFFDLEFAVNDDDETEENDDIEEEGDNVEDGDEESDDQNEAVDAKSDGDGEFNFTFSSGSSGDPSDPNLTLSPSDDLFFKGKLVPIETESSMESKVPQFPVSLMKSATKFRVFLLRLKKSKLNSAEKTESDSANEPVSAPKQETIQEENKKSKLFTVKFKVEEVPIMSSFSRDNSKSAKQQSSEEDSVSDDKKFTKDVMQKYLNKVKPLYVKVSRKYGEKLKFSGQLNLGSLKPSTPPSTTAQKPVPTAEKGQVEVEVGKNLKQMNIPAGLRVVCKHLGKSRSASSAVVAAVHPTAPAVSKRRDDSLLQQQDGIQGAILHCKRSFNGCQDSSESTILPRSVSDPSHEKSRKSSPDEAKA